MKPRPFAALVAVTALALLFAIVSYASNNRWAPAKISGTPLLPALWHPGRQDRQDRDCPRRQDPGARARQGELVAGRPGQLSGKERERPRPHRQAGRGSKRSSRRPRTRTACGLLDLEDPSAKDAKSRLVRLLDDKGAAIAEVIIGKKRFDAFGANKSGTYMRRPSEDQAWLTDADVDVAMNVRDWVRPQVLDLPTSKISSVTVEIPGEEPLKIAREGDKYAIRGRGAEGPQAQGWRQHRCDCACRRFHRPGGCPQAR